MHEFETMRHTLPECCASVLNTGSGGAGIDVLMSRHDAPQDLALYLLNTARVDRTIHHEFRPCSAFYNAHVAARGLRLAKNLLDHLIHAYKTGAGAIPINRGVDLVNSLLSWGFHNPVSHRANTIGAVVAAGGDVILDIHRSAPGFVDLR